MVYISFLIGGTGNIPESCTQILMYILTDFTRFCNREIKISFACFILWEKQRRCSCGKCSFLSEKERKMRWKIL
ncbi:MAG TPA: hypothetical protein DCZ91_15905 [Lachnospiraceae bacterium]|nr:hypothetical protein [Lachnospiraceae bacterium]